MKQKVAIVSTDSVSHIIPGNMERHVQTSTCPCAPVRDLEMEQKFPDRVRECWRHNPLGGEDGE